MPLTDDTVVIPRQAPGGGQSFKSGDRWKDAGPASEDVTQQRSGALRVLAWSVPMIVMAAFVFVRASWPGLWADELATWGMATAPWSELIQVLLNMDATIGPYYILMHGWVKLFGASDLALRLPSMLAAIGAAGLLAALGNRLAGPRVGLLAGTFFALVPATSRYGQEARPYSLTLFLAVLATWLLVVCLDRPRPLPFAGYSVAVSLLGLSHIVALLLLVAHGMMVIFLKRRILAGWLLAAMPAVVAALPLLYLGKRQQGQISWIPDPTPERLALFPQELFGSTLAAGLLLSLAFLAVSADRSAVLAFAWAFVPALGLLLVAQITPLWLPRYLLFTLPAWVLLAALTAARFPIVRGLLCAVLLVSLTMQAHIRIREVDGHSHDSRGVGALLNEHAFPDDVIVYGTNASGDQRVSRDAVARYTDPAHLPKDVLLTSPARTNGSFTAKECPDIMVCFGDPIRVWVVRRGTKADVLDGLGSEKEDLIRERYIVAEVYRPTGFTVALLVPKADSPDTAA